MSKIRILFNVINLIKLDIIYFIILKTFYFLRNIHLYNVYVKHTYFI